MLTDTLFLTANGSAFIRPVGDHQRALRLGFTLIIERAHWPAPRVCSANRYFTRLDATTFVEVEHS